jgi:hypothetical protein
MGRLLSACAFVLVAACGSDTEEDHDADQTSDAGSQGGDGDDQSGGDAGSEGGDGDAPHGLSFFVSSDKSMTGDLGGLAGADARCKALAEAVGAGAREWHAYLSTEQGGADDGPVHARDRIGDGPWYNAKGKLVASDVEALHARSGDVEVFLDEHGEKINGQWPGSPEPNEHDVLTGTGEDGRVLSGSTCKDWTSASAMDIAQVGHTDGLGPDANPEPPYNSWFSVHPSAGCNDTAPRGGAGRIYCFASD